MLCGAVNRVGEFCKRLPGGPDDMIVRADGKELWATARFARQVQVLDLVTKKIKQSIKVGSSPHGVFFTNHAGLR